MQSITTNPDKHSFSLNSYGFRW